MAASMEKDEPESSDNPENALKSVIIQFFEMVPIRRVKWESGDLLSQNLDVITQREVLNKTFGSEMCKRYPPSVGYRKAFVKKLLHVLEEYGVEICDEIYEVYTELLQQNEGEENLCYKTYTVDGANHVTLQESVNMLSFGTTGLTTWQAAQHLSEWVIQNRHLLYKKNVLELGSGLGLTGIVTCKHCQVNSYTFTDLPKQVLELLANNIHRNLSQIKTVHDERQHSQNMTDSDLEISCQPTLHNDSLQSDNVPNTIVSESSDDVNDFDEVHETAMDNSSEDPDRSPNIRRRDMDEFGAGDGDGLLDLCTGSWERHASFNTYVYKGRAGVRMAHLDWEHLDDELVEHLTDADVVLAADVVYDSRIIPHLVSTLKKFLYSNLTRKEPTCAYLSSTIRNEDTRDQFLIALSSEGLNYQPIEGPQLQLFHYDKSVPIEILKITAADL